MGWILSMESIECFLSCAAFVPGQPQCLLEHTQQNVLSWLPWTNTGNVEENALSTTMFYSCSKLHDTNFRSASHAYGQTVFWYQGHMLVHCTIDS